LTHIPLSAKDAESAAGRLRKCFAAGSVLRALLSPLFLAGCIIATCTAFSNLALAVPMVTLAPSLPTPQPLGTAVTLSAGGSDTDPGTLSYRFEIGPAGGANLAMVRDFSTDNTFVLALTARHGSYQFVVTARNNSTLNTGTFTYSPFEFTSLVMNGAPTITPTANPLVALFSSPGCAAGGLWMRVRMLRMGSTVPSYTSWQSCGDGGELDFVLAGMRASTLYSINSQTSDGRTLTQGRILGFTTGVPAVTFPQIRVPVPFSSADSEIDRFILMATSGFPMAVDLSAAPVWYYVDPSGQTPQMTRPVAGGKILMFANGANSAGTTVNLQQILREIDLEGNIIRETNATRVSEQLVAMSGIASNCQIGGTDCLGGAFHHEAVQLPDGHTLVLMDEEKIFTDGTQGSSATNPADIVGDIIVDLDPNWQVAWYWRAFDHLNNNRAAILGETCTNGQAGCPPILLTTGVAQDWLHGNALYFVPFDGSVLFSMRHQDWIVKIDYNNGAGTGTVIWRLGKGGDFSIDSTDPYPWFSHQHDPGFLRGAGTYLALFDNGNTRVSPPPLGLGSGNSRGYVLQLDQMNKVATPVLLADLGFYSFALGSAQLLGNGDYNFDAGAAFDADPIYNESIEVSPAGTIGFALKITGATCYRSFRLPNLYTAPEKD
jgi:hypothetical protein